MMHLVDGKRCTVSCPSLPYPFRAGTQSQCLQVMWCTPASLGYQCTLSIRERKQKSSSISADISTRTVQFESLATCKVQLFFPGLRLTRSVCFRMGWEGFATALLQPGKVHSEHRSHILKGLSASSIKSYDALVQKTIEQQVLARLANRSEDPEDIITRYACYPLRSYKAFAQVLCSSFL